MSQKKIERRFWTRIFQKDLTLTFFWSEVVHTDFSTITTPFKLNYWFWSVLEWSRLMPKFTSRLFKRLTNLLPRYTSTPYIDLLAVTCQLYPAAGPLLPPMKISGLSLHSLVYGLSISVWRVPLIYSSNPCGYWIYKCLTDSNKELSKMFGDDGKPIYYNTSLRITMSCCRC